MVINEIEKYNGMLCSRTCSRSLGGPNIRTIRAFFEAKNDDPTWAKAAATYFVQAMRDADCKVTMPTTAPQLPRPGFGHRRLQRLHRVPQSVGQKRHHRQGDTAAVKIVGDRGGEIVNYEKDGDTRKLRAFFERRQVSAGLDAEKAAAALPLPLKAPAMKRR